VNDPQRIVFSLATLSGAVGMWLMLPRGTRRGWPLGAALMVLALVGWASVTLGVWISQVPLLGDWATQGVFSVLAAVTVVAAIATVTMRNPVYSAIWFGMSLLGTAGLYLLVGAQFLAVATVVVYAGAILVTFLFVLMLAQPEGRAGYDGRSWEALVSAATGIVIVGILSMTFAGALGAGPIMAAERAAGDRAAGVLVPQHVAQLGAELFGRHLIAVEVAGTLLLAALVGAAVVAAQARTRETPQPASGPEDCP
jgi:NADH-quinone oxidoreductase subunit J